MTKRFSILRNVCLLLACQASVWAQTITNQPQSVTVNNASTAEFYVGATNATNYQWQFKGTNLSDGGNISGSSTSALMLDDVNSNENGSYSVVINETNVSSNATLNVVPGTVITFVISGLTNGGSNSVDVQLFDHDKPATVTNFLHYVTSGAFTNMFFERDGGGGIQVLQGGSFRAIKSDRNQFAHYRLGYSERICDGNESGPESALSVAGGQRVWSGPAHPQPLRHNCHGAGDGPDQLPEQRLLL